MCVLIVWCNWISILTNPLVSHRQFSTLQSIPKKLNKKTCTSKTC